MQSHAFSHAAPGPNFNRAPSEGPKLTRPSIDVGVSLGAWNVFTRHWQMFRQGSGINEASATAQLFQCASQSLGASLLKSDAEIVSKFLQELLSAFRRLAVFPVASGGYWVRRMRQLPRRPLENSTYSFNSLQMFFRGYYEVGTKSGKYKIDLR